MERIEVLGQAINTFFERQIREPTDAMSNNISQLGYPVRRMVLNRVAGKYKKKINVATQKRFHAGKVMHDIFKHQILPTIPNVSVQSTELPVDDRKAEIRGYIDASIRIGEEGPFPSEIKSMMYLKKISSPKEFLNSDEKYLQCYYHALNLYLFCSNKPEGQFILSDFAFNYILLPMTLDYDQADKIMEKCIKEVNPLVHKWDNKVFPFEAVQDLPDCGDACDKYCPFESLCGRIFNPAGDMADLDLERIDYLAEKKLTLGEVEKEYKEVKDELTEITKGHPNIITSNYILAGGFQNGPPTIPKEIREQHQVPGKPYWRIKRIMRIEGNNEK